MENDVELEKTRGGSHGVGKIACNAASDIHMMFLQIVMQMEDNI